jgi:hypothetical protein
MRYVLLLTMLLVGFLTSAQAQFRDNRYSPESVTRLVDRVHDDLSRGYEKWRISNDDRGRLNGAEKKLRDFEKNWRNGKFDKGELDEAIASIQHVLDNNYLSGPERDRLNDDVGEFRAMRQAYDRHEIG